MAEEKDFEIEDGVLTKYNGQNSDLILPEGITHIGKYSVSGNTNIKSITIPKTVTKIDEYGFSFSDNIKKINVDKENKFFTSVDGVLYTKDKSILLMAPEGIEDNFIIPSFVKEIGKNAFTGCKKLTSIVIPPNVTIIQDSAFAACTSLKDITISENVNEIGDACFIDSKNLTIHGKKDSYVEFYSQINNINFISM